MSTDPKSTYYDHGGIETVEILRAKLTSEQYQGYLLGNVLKYASRLNWKGASERDAEKLSLYAMWLHEELAPPPAERQEQVRERHDIVPESVRSSATMVPGRCPGNGNRDVCVHECRESCAVNGLAIGPGEGWQEMRPPDRPLASHCPDGGACKHKCGLEPCRAQS